MNFKEWLIFIPEKDYAGLSVEAMKFAELAFDAGKRHAKEADNILWMKPTQYEPVGTTVKVKTKCGKVLFAYRKSPTVDKNRTGTYYNKVSGELITEDVIGWSYP